ncbi:hypothetical protein M2371_001824 [Buttiauxella sp. BIGb0471]|nr:hypothetical protein [Buttiauxella sp. BIGb0471]
MDTLYAYLIDEINYRMIMEMNSFIKLKLNGQYWVIKTLSKNHLHSKTSSRLGLE